MVRLFDAIILFLLLLTFFYAQGQDTWDLARCIRYAQEHHFSKQQANFDLEAAEIDLRQSRYNMLPNLSGSVNGFLRFGRSIDPTTNSFNTEAFGSQGVSVDAGWTVFQGGQLRQTVQRNKLNAQAALASAEATDQALAVRVLESYSAVLLAQEQVEIAQLTAALTESQIERMAQLVESGLQPEVERIQLEAQLGLDQQAIWQAREALALADLQLKQWMNLTPDYPLVLERPELPDTLPQPPAGISELAYQEARRLRAPLRAAELRQQVAGADLQVARLAFWPTLNVGGSVYTNFSSRGQRVIDQIVGTQTEQVVINGEPAVITRTTNDVIYENNPYLNQLNENFGYGVGASLIVPLYDNHRNRLGVERARLAQVLAAADVQQNEYLLSQELRELTARVQTNYQSLIAARQSATAAEAAGQVAADRFRLGTINSLDLITTQRTLAQARHQLARAEFAYQLSTWTLEYYYEGLEALE